MIFSEICEKSEMTFNQYYRNPTSLTQFHREINLYTKTGCYIKSNKMCNRTVKYVLFHKTKELNLR